MRRSSVIALTLGWATLSVALVNFLYHFSRVSESYLHAVFL